MFALMFLYSLIALSLTAVMTAAGENSTTISSAGTGIFDLTANGMNDAGIGFTFSDSNSMADAKSYVSKQLPKCKIGPLDSIYFYLYGCTVPNDFVTDMAKEVGSGFLYTSDKSVTIVTDVSSSSLLVANAWDLQLSYSETNNCDDDFRSIQAMEGCLATSTCESGKNKLITVNCGSMACTGCNIENFFTDYYFVSAKFDTGI